MNMRVESETDGERQRDGQSQRERYREVRSESWRGPRRRRAVGMGQELWAVALLEPQFPYLCQGAGTSNPHSLLRSEEEAEAQGGEG